MAATAARRHHPAMHDTLRIRPESRADHAAQAAINRQAFADQPHSDHQEEHLLTALRAAGGLALSLLAEVATATTVVPVGHVAYSPVRFDGCASNWFALAPLAVLPAYQRQGIGTALVAAGLRQLAAGGAAGCVVLGEPAYYRRFGFMAGLNCEFAVPAGYFMALPLNGNDWPLVAEVAFHPLFSAPDDPAAGNRGASRKR